MGKTTSPQRARHEHHAHSKRAASGTRTAHLNRIGSQAFNSDSPKDYRFQQLDNYASRALRMDGNLHMTHTICEMRCTRSVYADPDLPALCMRLTCRTLERG